MNRHDANAQKVNPHDMCPNDTDPNDMDPNGMDPNGMNPNGMDPNDMFPNDMPQAHAARSLAANRWMFVPVALLGLTVTVATVTVTSAVVGHPLGAEPRYDSKAADFGAELEQRAANERLRWVVTPEIESHGSQRVLAVRIEDKHAARIDADHVRVECIPVVNAEARLAVDLRRSGPGEFEATFDSAFGGQWEFRISVEQGVNRYTDAFRRFLAPVAKGAARD
jgi:nitrogen fixation protein FixH